MDPSAISFFTTFFPCLGVETSHDATKLNVIHEMLRLPVGVAALGTSHPVCREYLAEAGGGIRRVFPIKGSAGVQVFTKHGDPQSETAKFVKALGGIGLF
jgi:hypothetical protein